VRESLGKFNAIPTIDFEAGESLNLPVFQEGDFTDVQEPSISIDNDFNPFLTGNAGDTSIFSTSTTVQSGLATNGNGFTNLSSTSGGTSQNAATFGDNSPSTHTPRGWENAFDVSQDENFTPTSHGNPALSTPNASFQWETPSTTDDQPTLYAQLGESVQQHWEIATLDFIQYKGRYLLAPTDEGLLIIDQHRAHMRILFDDYVRQISRHEQAAQGLLFPQIIEVAPNQMAILQAIESELTDIGFELSYLGNNSYSVLSAPASIDGIDPVLLLQNILDDAQQHDTEIHEEVVNSIALSMARKSALPVGQFLNTDEM